MLDINTIAYRSSIFFIVVSIEGSVMPVILISAGVDGSVLNIDILADLITAHVIKIWLNTDSAAGLSLTGIKDIAVLYLDLVGLY